ncbi:carbohydrate ABC transporter permease, partial [Rhizobium phaseoli]
MANIGTLNTTAAGIDAVSQRLGDGPSGPKPRPALSPRNIMLYGTLTVAALYYLLPLYVMVVTSLKGMPEIRLGNIFS